MYKVYFADGTEFIGGNPTDSKWNEMPDKPIVSLEYSLVGLRMAFQGFEQYNHILEKVVILNGSQIVKKTGHRISKVILMGQWKNKIYEVVYDFNRAKLFQKIEVGQKYTGWKRGAFDPNVFPKIKRI